MIDRIRRALAAVSDYYSHTVEPVSTQFGQAFGCESWAVKVGGRSGRAGRGGADGAGSTCGLACPVMDVTCRHPACCSWSRCSAYLHVSMMV